MTSPRCGRRCRKHILVLLIALFAGAVRGLAQEPSGAIRMQRPGDTAPLPGDTGAVQPADSTVRNGMRPAGAGADTLRPDSAGARRAPPPPPPVDSALARACRAGGGAPPDLLTVTFRPTTSAAERAAVAREVGGTLLEPSEHQAPGAWYIRVPGSGLDRSVADRLIMLQPVLEVGATRCPA
jgi:hypothetical protein